MWLPDDGTYSFSVKDGTAVLSYCAVVNNRDVTVEPLPPSGEVGFFVNGRDVSKGPGAEGGWTYVNGILTLDEKRNYVLSGAVLKNEVLINVTASGAQIVLSNAVVFTEGRSVLAVKADVSLLMAGDTSCLAATNGFSAVTIARARRSRSISCRAGIALSR